MPAECDVVAFDSKRCGKLGQLQNNKRQSRHWGLDWSMNQEHIHSIRNGTATGDGFATLEFSAIAESHRPQIFRFMLASLRDVDIAETLTQECFLKAHRNWSKFRGESSARTWLMRIAINLQKDHWRNRRMQFWRHTCMNAIDLREVGEWLPSRESSPEQRLVAREQVAQVWKAVDGMSERRRTVFLLRYVEELELNEIARSTGLHEGTVKAHLSRAVARVRRELRGTT